MRLGIVSGLERERRACARGWGHGYTAEAPLYGVGMGPEAAAGATRDLIERGVSLIVSFGLAGALEPRLRPGSLVVPAEVGDGATSYPVASAPLRAALEGEGGRLLSVAVPLVDPDAKLDAAVKGFDAVDMESFAAADVAHAAGVRFLAVRAISDPARRPLPHVARVAVGANGKLRPLAIAAALTGRPGDWPLVWRTALDVRAAEASLRRAAATLARLTGQGLL
ncbi:MAG: hypothetical protein EA356_02650 [Geminicoccaceae bacterium]|nr:MAG: hypothetical protein EA356_02650 [Geminicoccaceae bacterium]